MKCLYSKIVKYRGYYFRYNHTYGVLEIITEDRKIIDGCPLYEKYWSQNYLQCIQDFYNSLLYKGELPK